MFFLVVLCAMYVFVVALRNVVHAVYEFSFTCIYLYIVHDCMRHIQNQYNYRDNPLGMGGVMAKRYGELVQDLWNGHSKSITPLKFRVCSTL